MTNDIPTLRWYGFWMFIMDYLNDNTEPEIKEIREYEDFVKHLTNIAWGIVEKNPSITVPEMKDWLKANVLRLKTEFFKKK